MLLTLAAASFACPTIATGTTNSLSFDTAQVVIVREGNRTTFSVSINPQGEGQGFALVMPVPEILEESEVRTLDGSIFATLDGYTAPRHVTDAGCPRDSSYSSSDSGDVDTDSDVDVVAEYLVGEYLITILDSNDADALGLWLDTNGYYLAPGAEPILAEYIDAGSYFMTAKVADEAAMADGTPLSPLQIAYDSPMFAIPIRLATLNSPGEQDMVIYTIVDQADGEVGISNYPSFEVPDSCVWGDPSTDDFATFYDALYRDAWTEVDDAAWAVEFSGGPYDCNPCTGVYPDGDQLADLGFTGNFDDHYMTRLHMRYTAAQAYQDLVFYASGIKEPDVLSYADDASINDCVEARCDGTPYGDGDADTDTDADTDADADADSDLDDGGEYGGGADCGCDSSGAPVGLAGLIALGLVRRRRSG